MSDALFIIAFSTALQCAAALLAFRLLFNDPRQRAWLLISAAVLFMAVRRTITLYRLFSGDLSHPPDPHAELVALSISALMVAGLSWLIHNRRNTAIQERERKLASQREREELIDSINGIVWEADPATFCFTFVSKKAERLLGYPVSMWTDDANFWCEHIHPLDRQRALAYCKESTEALLDHEFEYRMIAADGHCVWLRDLVSVVATDGKAVKLRGVMVDISHEHQLEEKLDFRTHQLQTTSRQLEEHSQLLAAYRAIGQMLLSSLDLDQVLDMLGQQITKNGIFRSLMIALVDHRTQQVEVVRGFRSTTETAEGFISSVRRKPIARYSLGDRNITAQVAREGQMCIIDGWDERLDTQFDPDTASKKVSFFIPIIYAGRVLAVLGTGCDPREKEATLERIGAMQPLLEAAAISLDHAYLHRELKASEEKLRQVQKIEAIGQLAAGISHHFNNMLQSVIGNINLARLDASGPTVQCLVDANDSAQRAAEMVRQLMAYSRSNTPRNLRELRVETVLADLKKQCRDTVPSHILLTIDTADKLPPIAGDPTQLKQALFSLCINARDAVEEASPTAPHIEIRAYAQQLPAGPNDEKTQHLVSIEVRDNGTGMSEQTQQHIFDPFFTTKNVGSGAGLGLSTVYGIAKQHGGWLDLHSEINAGSVFTLHLPIYNSGDHCPPEQGVLLFNNIT